MWPDDKMLCSLFGHLENGTFTIANIFWQSKYKILSNVTETLYYFCQIYTNVAKMMKFRQIWSHCGHRYHLSAKTILKRWCVIPSVTRFGEISPLWLNLKSFRQFFGQITGGVTRFDKISPLWQIFNGLFLIW